MSTVLLFKKGDILFKEGDKIENLQIIQNGGVSLFLSRGKKNLDLSQLGSGQVLGEQINSSSNTYNVSCVATNETKVLIVSQEMYKQALESSSQVIKIVIKSLTDRLKLALNEIRSSRIEKDSSPCPEDQVAKVFGVIYHAVQHKGETSPKDPNKISIEWTLLKQYCQRVFLESPKRLEQSLHLLSKINLIKMEFGVPPENPEGPEELQKIHFFNLPAIEAFFEFYQYYYFKGGKMDLLKFEESSYHLLNHIYKLTEPLEADRFGVVQLDYSKAIDSFKNELGINLNANHFNRLEQKGVFIKRASRPDGTVVLQFERKEIDTTLKVWLILYEIDKWNRKGFVDLDDDEVLKPPQKKSDGPVCPQCQQDITQQAKFCPECGFKLVA